MSTVEDFIPVFDEGWRQTGGLDGFLAFFAPHLDPDIRLSGPLTPGCRGLAQFTEFFTLLFGVIPDLHGAVKRSQALDQERAYVWLQLQGTIGGRPVTFDLRDRLLVRDGKLLERAAKGLPLGFAIAILRTPRAWRRAARLLLRTGWAAPPSPR